MNEDRQELITSAPRGAALQNMISAEIDQQIATAKEYPRSIKRVVDEVKSLATLDPRTAESCRYALRRKNKVIEGPSVRFAEILASCWGNARFGSRVVDQDGRHVTAQGFFADLERNTAVTVDVKRRITDSNGRTYNDDMITVTSQAAGSIALRNAVFAGVPRALWESAYRAVVEVIEGTAEDLTKRRNKMLQVLKGQGLSEDRIFAACGAEGIEDINLKRLALVRALYQAVVDGDAKLDDQFPQVDQGDSGKRGQSLDDLASKKKNGTAKKSAPKKPAKPKATATPVEAVSPFVNKIRESNDAAEIEVVVEEAAKSEALDQEAFNTINQIAQERTAELASN